MVTAIQLHSLYKIDSRDHLFMELKCHIEDFRPPLHIASYTCQPCYGRNPQNKQFARVVARHNELQSVPTIIPRTLSSIKREDYKSTY